MTLQNRVLPTGEIVAHPARGDMMGNRGILHDANRHLGIARWRHQAWVTCVLEFKGRQRSVMSPGTYTELFFLDEAVALAAGHRPCGECRRDDYKRFRSLWIATHGDMPLKEIDRAMHKDRITRTRTQVRHLGQLETLADGVFVLLDAQPHLVWSDRLFPFAPEGYGAPVTRGAGMVEVLTPKSTVAVLAAGYRPMVHPSVMQ